MLTKQERRTQKKVLEQRNEARTEVDTLKAEVERLKGDVKVLAAEEIRRIEREAAEEISKAGVARARAERERDDLMKDFEGALSRKLDETKAELERVRGLLTRTQNVAAELEHSNRRYVASINELRDTVAQLKAEKAPLEAELTSLKLEDTKNLRKRLQAKSQRVEELERENAQLKKAPAPAPVPVSPQALSSMLNVQLRKKLEEDGRKAERVPEPEAKPAEQPQP